MVRVLAAILLGCLLAACDRGQPRQSNGSDGQDQLEALPRPDANGGSVTGFDGDAPPPPPAAPARTASDATDALVSTVAGADGGFDLATLPGTAPEVLLPTGATPSAAGTAPVPPPPAGPGAAEAAAVVRSYYSAINAGQYPRAYALWSDGGRASGQTGEQFAGGFSNTRQVTVNAGAPGRIEGAAGSRYITIPVAVEAVDADGNVHHYDGSYTLRRAVVDGATAEQRQWRISDADLREVK